MSGISFGRLAVVVLIAFVASFATVFGDGVRIGRLETVTGEMRTSITKLEAKR